MDSDPLSINIQQPALFDFSAATTGAVELFPAVWSALEDLASPEVGLRRSGLARLIDIRAPRLSPLVAYMLSTRLAEPDLELRERLIRTLGEVLAPDAKGLSAPESVLRYLNARLAQLSIPEIIDMLEVVAHQPTAAPFAARLLNACAYAGGYLVEIISDRKQILPVRIQGAYLVGMVGFLDAIPALERLESRLAARLEGQQAMPFAPPALTDEVDLLPALRTAIEQLRAR